MVDSHDEELELMRSAYLGEVRAYSDELEEQIMGYQDNGGDLNSLLRVVHSIKGEAGAFQLSNLVALSHRFESLVISDPKIDRDGLVTKMLKFNDLLKEVVTHYKDGKPHTAIELQAKISRALGLVSDSNSEGPYRVLLVEPSVLIRTLVVKALDELGIEVTVERNALDALEHILAQPFDCIITAVQTGVIDGLSLIDSIYAIRGLKQKPKTVLISSSEPDPQEYGVAPDHFLKKDNHIKKSVRSLFQPYARKDGKVTAPKITKVLMVDDSEEFHALFKLAYKGAKIETACLGDPRRAEEVVNEVNPDLILLDVMMPNRSGPEVLQGLQEKGHLKKRPVFFLTALSSAEERNKLVKLGAHGIIKKPFSHKELPIEIEKLWVKYHQA